MTETPRARVVQVISVDAKVILEAFILMLKQGIGDLPVREGLGIEKAVRTNCARDVRFVLLKPKIFAEQK